MSKLIVRDPFTKMIDALKARHDPFIQKILRDYERDLEEWGRKKEPAKVKKTG